MPYDVDVLVVGAGPAGLAAATRVRWVKGYHALGSSVLVVESGRPGGLLSWGSCVLTGPGWAFSGEELTTRLLEDVERLRIPIVSGRVRAIARAGRLLCTTLAGGRTIRSLAVILATGFRPLANETDYYLRGVRITFKGYDHFPSLVRACVRDAGDRPLVVVGNARSSHLRAILDANAAETEVVLLDRSELLEVQGESRVDAVRVRDPDGAERTLPCGAVLMDYNAFELAPSFDVGGLALERDARGFVRVDAWMATSCPGVFAAGDITGRYASTLMALGDGVAAGFGAYRAAFREKLGAEPRLFAYAATDAPLPAEPRDIPPVPEGAVLVALDPAADTLHGRRVTDLSPEEQRRMDALLLEKRVTFHHLARTPEGAA